MATFVTIKAVFLFEKPNSGSKNLGTVPRETTLKGKLRNDDGFIETTEPVKIKKPDGSFDTAMGFLAFLDFAREVLDEPLPISPEDAGTFCALVTDAAREASTDRDYLLAVAYALSGNLKNLGTAATKAGPFRYSGSQWKEATETGAAKGLGLSPEDRLRWNMQPRVAAFLTADQAKKFKDTFANPPKFNQLLFVQLFGDGATRILKETLNNELSTTIDAAALDAELAAELKADPLTVDGVLAKLQARLEKAYIEARKVIDLQPADIRLFRAHEDDLPWMAVAREEMSAGVSEDANQRNTPQINSYFTAINAAPGATKPWCGAFVGYCVKQCSVEAVAATVKPEAASTVFWEKEWGVTVTTKPFPIGSIVVLKPENSDGHVGFHAEGSTDDVICILGGNQGTPGHVSIARFPVSNIIAVKSMPFAAPENVVVVDPTRLAQAPAQIRQTLPMAQRAFARLRAAKWTPAQACGILASIQAESSFDFKNTTGDGGKAHGICQWHFDRRKIFEENFRRPFAQSTFEDQVDFITFEMNHNEKTAGDLLKQDTTPAAAAKTVCSEYERPADKVGDSQKRMPLAEAYALVFR